jgi:hypothetical protein
MAAYRVIYTIDYHFSVFDWSRRIVLNLYRSSTLYRDTYNDHNNGDQRWCPPIVIPSTFGTQENIKQPYRIESDLNQNQVKKPGN